LSVILADLSTPVKGREMTAGVARESVRRPKDTSWAQLHEEGGHPWVARFAIGSDEDDRTRPIVLRSNFPPGYKVGPHTHPSDYAEIVQRGSLKVGRQWYHPGDIRIVDGGTTYGPLEAGPEGADVLIIFRDSRTERIPPRPGVRLWLEPTPGDRQYSDPPAKGGAVSQGPG
jgi:hypothetical protein